MLLSVKKISLQIICVVLLSLISIGQINFVQANEMQLIDADKQFSFAEALFTEGDYYRAITEYKRFNFYFSNHKLAEKALYRIGDSYFRAKKWQEAVDAFSLFKSKYPQSSMSTDAQYFIGLSERQLKLYNNAISTFQEIIKSKSETRTNDAIYQNALILMDMGEWEKARKTFLRIPKDSHLYISSNIMSSGLENIDNIPQKSPVLAGTLAAILPGAGHLYTERPRDGIASFLLNGVFILAAIELFNHDNNIAGGIVTFFEIGWYTGNIYSAVSSAHKYNKKTREDFIEHLKNAGSVSFYHDPKTYANYLMLSFKFE